MRLDQLGIDPRIVAKLAEEGIHELYPPQAEAVVPALAGGNVVVAIPTASGKSLVAYLAILRAVLRGGKALYIVPLKALASEKFEELSRFESLGITVGESTGDYDDIDPKLDRYDVVVATSEKVDSLLRHRTRWLERISVVVADEVHLINDPDRGPTLEVILVKFKKFNPDAQIVALSATIRNAEELAQWLGADLVRSDWRPVPLREGVCADGEIFFTDNSRRKLLGEESPVREIVRDTLDGGGQCLVFVNTRRSSEALAVELAPLVKKHNRGDPKRLAEVSSRLAGTQEEPTNLASKLSKTVRKGCAFHHAGLTSSHRKLVEGAFKEGLIGVITATPTLAAGINLPARTVIVRDIRRFDSNMGFTTIPVLEVKQMCGRAGRPRYDEYGEAILIAKSEPERELMLDTYLLGENENLYSKLGTEPAIRSHVLALIATGDTSSFEQLTEFFGRTFLAHQTDAPYLEQGIRNVLAFLKAEGMVEEEEDLRATKLGKRVSDLYIDPQSAVKIMGALKNFKEGAEAGLLHAICATPDMNLLYMRRSDYEWVEEYLGVVRESLLLEMPDELEGYEIFLSEVKTSKLIADWISERPENDITEQYGIGPGDIRNKVELAQWLMHATNRLAGLVNRDALDLSSEMVKRISYGIRPELLELVKLRGVGRVRARALFQRKIRTLEDLRSTSYDRLRQIPTIGETLAKSIKAQLGQSEPGIPVEPLDGQRSLQDFR
jgi:helicase